MSQSLLIINFYNYSATTFHLDSTGQELQNGGNSVVTWPGAGSLLQAEDGFVSCEITENLHNLDVGPCTFWCCWNDGTNRFGVQINTYLQIANAGDRPDWNVTYGPMSSSITWNHSGNDPSDSYTWPTSVGYNIVGTPNSTHQSLTVDVYVKNLLN